MEVKKIPRGNRTGPRGLGPMTGRAAGYCAGYPIPGFMNPTPRPGRGFGWRRGSRGWGRGWPTHVPWQTIYPPPTYAIEQPRSPTEELLALEDYKKELKAEKEDLEQEMKELETRIEKATLEEQKE